MRHAISSWLVVIGFVSSTVVYADCTQNYNDALNRALNERAQCYRSMGYSDWALMYLMFWEDDYCQVRYQQTADLAATVYVDCIYFTGPRNG